MRYVSLVMMLASLYSGIWVGVVLFGIGVVFFKKVKEEPVAIKPLGEV